MILDFLLLDTIRYNRVKEGNVSGSINQDIYNDTNVTVTSDCYTRCQIRSVHFNTTSVIGLY